MVNVSITLNRLLSLFKHSKAAKSLDVVRVVAPGWCVMHKLTIKVTVLTTNWLDLVHLTTSQRTRDSNFCLTLQEDSPCV